MPYIMIILLIAYFLNGDHKKVSDSPNSSKYINDVKADAFVKEIHHHGLLGYVKSRKHNKNEQKLIEEE